MHMDYWESLTNRIHGNFSSRSTMRVLIDPWLCLTRAPPSSVRYVNSLCGVTLSVVRRRDLQQCSNNISVFIFV